MVKELADVVFPRYVTSREGAGKRQTACSHLCIQFRGPPSDWKTVCGWRWVTAARECQQTARPPPGADMCKRCIELTEGTALAVSQPFSVRV